MTDGPDWEPTFKEVAKIPGTSAQTPQQKTYEDRIREVAFFQNKNKIDVAVAMGAVETDDFDPDEWLFDFGQNTTANTEAIANLETIAAAMNATAAYVGALQDMVSAPRSDLRIWGGNLSTYADYDDIDEPRHKCVVPTLRPSYTFSSSWGDIYYAPIVVNRHGIVDKFRWITGADTSIFSINFYEVALCVYNPATSAIEKVWTSGDIKDTTASVSGNPQEVEIAMGIEQEVTPGQILFGAMQQTAPGAGQTTRRFAVVPQPNIARPVSLAPLDCACYVAELHTQGIPSSIALSSLTKDNTVIPWVAVSVDTIDPVP